MNFICLEFDTEYSTCHPSSHEIHAIKQKQSGTDSIKHHQGIIRISLPFKSSGKTSDVRILVGCFSSILSMQQMSDIYGTLMMTHA